MRALPRNPIPLLLILCSQALAQSPSPLLGHGKVWLLPRLDLKTLGMSPGISDAPCRCDAAGALDPSAQSVIGFQIGIPLGPGTGALPGKSPSVLESKEMKKPSP